MLAGFERTGAWEHVLDLDLLELLDFLFDWSCEQVKATTAALLTYWRRHHGRDA
ncbi:MAG: hypothetical protein WD027_04005 [Gaiellales bacterium]